MKPIPVPAKYLYPYVGSWVLKGKGRGQPKMTLGLPMLITTTGLALEFNACLAALCMLPILGIA